MSDVAKVDFRKMNLPKKKAEHNRIFKTHSNIIQVRNIDEKIFPILELFHSSVSDAVKTAVTLTILDEDKFFKTEKVESRNFTIYLSNFLLSLVRGQSKQHETTQSAYIRFALVNYANKLKSEFLL